MKKVTKQIAKEFAQKFFGTGKAKLNTLDDGVFSYQLGKITLEIFPFYGIENRAKYDEPYAFVHVDNLCVGTAKLVQETIEYSSLASEAIDLMRRLASTLLRAVDEESLNESNGSHCIESNLLLFQAVQLAKQVEKF